MAKKKETLTLDEVRRCTKLYQSFHNCTKVNMERLAKELGIKKLDLWEFIQNNESYFITRDNRSVNSGRIMERYIEDILDTPMSVEELCNMKRQNEKKYEQEAKGNHVSYYDDYELDENVI